MTNEQSTFLEELQKAFVSKSKVQEEAMSLLREIGLPSKKSEAYKFTAITSVLEKKVDLHLNESIVKDKSLFYKTEGSHIIIENGVFSEKESVLEKGLVLKVGDVTEGKHDPLSLLNTALSEQELSISVSKEIAPIFIYHFNSIGFSNPRIKVKSSVGQQITLVEKSFNGKGAFTNSYIEFDLASNSRIDFSKVQSYPEESNAHETIFAKQQRDSRFYTNVFSFAGGLIRNNVTINLDGENSEGHMHGLYLLDGKTHVDNNTSVDHLKPNSYSNELYKGIMDEKSKGVFNGKIYVRPDAQKTNAFQSNNNILLSDGATVNTKPQLEIWADDVKCSHGCTTGQLDEDAIFYLRARGIAEKSAKAMILNAFAAETLAEITIPELKEEVQSLIDKKLF